MIRLVPLPDPEQPRKRGWEGVTVRHVQPQEPPTDAPPRAILRGVHTPSEDLQRRVPFGVFGPIREVPVSEFTTIELPRRTRDGSVTDEQVRTVRDAIESGKVPPRQAVVVGTGIEKENTARNRARSLATRYAELFPDAKPLSAHAVPDPDAGQDEKGKPKAYVAAVTERQPKPDAAAKAKPKAKPKPAPQQS